MLFLFTRGKEGIGIGVKKDHNLKPVTQSIQANSKLQEKITAQVNKGRIMGPYARPPIHDLMISPVCTIPKPNSTKVGMIFNLSKPKGTMVNDNIRKDMTSNSHYTVKQVAKWISKNENLWYLLKVNLTNAYRMVLIKKDICTHLGMWVGEHNYIDRCLSMGRPAFAPFLRELVMQ